MPSSAAWTPPAPPLLCIGHMDTVFDPGTAAERPFAIQAGIATGPGVTDMKSGLLAGLYAIAALGRRSAGCRSDGSSSSPTRTRRSARRCPRPHIRRLAASADACLVLECARANGDIVSSRKGTLDLVVTVNGRAAHAGVEPEKGRSAILEAARIVDGPPCAQRALAGRHGQRRRHRGRHAPERRRRALLARGGRARGHPRGLEAAEAAIREILVPRLVPDVTRRRSSRPAATGRWRSSSGPGGWSTTPLRWRRASASSCATPPPAVPRTPTRPRGWACRRIDGLGPIGGLDHSPGEYLEVASIVPRTTLLAALIAAIGRDPEVGRWRAERLATAGAAQ